MDLGLQGRRAAVAAATSGLGLATAKALHAEGARVAICGRDRGRLDAAVGEIGEGVHGVVADVGTPEGAAGFVEAAQDALGGVDVLVVNAGGPPAGDFAQTPVDAYRAALDLNLMSVVAMCKAAVPAMRERGWGRVVAITSLSVRQPIGGLILSNTARAGATGFLKTLALEVAGDGVTVNSLLPGSHDTARLRSLWGGSLEEAGASIPAGRVGDAGDFGAFAAFLCSAQAGFVTGGAIAVDGGEYRALL
ncbi:SDR family oxidoreductase [Actinomadura parmotrematis]|uniref:SDR family oxidoreductase n=1 Tax=Actinomadura parmotrematis TaxID=2864039 RepID=A0ABS7FZW0_9ACTN|nr:SDR family oxidoreductase [Actinomadura parmotrematis]MBW8485989.1 SDR family oxidoreductase [Actinomadura parmotrematis]